MIFSSVNPFARGPASAAVARREKAVKHAVLNENDALYKKLFL